MCYGRGVTDDSRQSGDLGVSRLWQGLCSSGNKLPRPQSTILPALSPSHFLSPSQFTPTAEVLCPVSPPCHLTPANSPPPAI